jgi:hypothetical protein
MKKYPTLSEELNSLPKERQESIEVRSAQIRLEEIDAALVEMAQDPEYQATVESSFKHCFGFIQIVGCVTALA